LASIAKSDGELEWVTIVECMGNYNRHPF